MPTDPTATPTDLPSPSASSATASSASSSASASVASATGPIAAAPTGVAAFVGRFATGEVDVAVSVTSAEEALARFGPALADGDTTLALAAYFANGGTKAHVVRVGPESGGPDPAAMLGSADAGTGLHALADVADIDLVCLPDACHLDAVAAGELYVEATEFCTARRAFLLVDLPVGVQSPQDILGWVASVGVRHRDAALYVPRVLVADPSSTGASRAIGASGAVAGVHARTDRARGIWKAPAGQGASLHGIDGLEIPFGDSQQSELNPNGVNLLREMPGRGRLVWGARTLVGDGSDQEWRYVPVRRTALWIERSLVAGLAWVSSETNDQALWLAIQARAEAFLHELWRQGGLQGQTSERAYFVHCGVGRTMTAADLDAGEVVVELGVALTRPSEFTNLRLRLAAGAGEPPTDPAPADPAPEEPAPTDPAPADPAPEEPAPADPAPAEPAEETPAGDVSSQQVRLREVIARARRDVPPRRRRGARWLGSGRGRQRGPRLVFAGAAGSGRSAAELVAAELDLVLLRIDLREVVSRYIGETEKNLRRVLDAADSRDVVLFFDEADALFGRRQAHGEPDDRYGRLHLERVVGWLDAHPGALILNVADVAVVRAAGVAVDEVVPFETRDDRADGGDRPSAR